MARDITTAFENEINAAHLRPAVFVKGEFDSGDINLWSGVGNITYSGDTYLGAGQLLNFNPVKETQKIQANGVEFTLNGCVDSLVSIAMNEEYQWRPISTWLGVLDDDFQIIANPYKIFAGKMDIIEIVDTGENSAITVKAESNLIDLKDTKERRYTHEDQIAEFTGDLGLEFMPTNADVEITWGASSKT